MIPRRRSGRTGRCWLLLVAVSLALGWILLPFYGTILWGAIIALLFAPRVPPAAAAAAGTGARRRRC